MTKKKTPASTTLRRRAGERASAGVRFAGKSASAGVRRAASAVKRARAWNAAREREVIPVSTIPPAPPPGSEEPASALDELRDAVKEHPIACLLGAVLGGYVLGRLLD